jgi:hypothetical protein
MRGRNFSECVFKARIEFGNKTNEFYPRLENKTDISLIHLH